MSDSLAVKTATISLQSQPPLTITVQTHTLSLANSGPFFTSESNEVLLEADIEASLKSYITQYTNAPYATPPGTLKFDRIKSISGLSELLTKDGEAVVTEKTEGTITCSVTVPAVDPKSPPASPVPDSTMSYDLDFSFTNVAQTLTSSD